MTAVLFGLGALVILVLCAYELRKPEVHGWLRRRRQSARRLWRGLFDGDA